MELNKIYNIDCLEGLKNIPDESVDCCVTSPPYWNLRDYGVTGQIGLESSLDAYITKIIQVFREVRRVLKEQGTLWLNLGDTYAGRKVSGQTPWDPTRGVRNLGENEYPGKCIPTGLKVKELIGIPWRIAFALQSDGWYLRQDIIWHKPNPMPESVRDRCTKSHEYIFLLSKGPRYFFDAAAISEPIAESTKKRLKQNIDAQNGYTGAIGKTNGNMKACAPRYGGKKYTENPEVFYRTKSGNAYDYKDMRNKRSVWTVATARCNESHFATFPEDLVSPCILAGCPEGGMVLDPFMGSGTSAVVAFKNNRNYVGFEINPDYCAIAENRIKSVRVQQAIDIEVSKTMQREINGGQ
jgi:DNA modification methylase